MDNYENVDYHESFCFSIFTLLAIIDISAVQSSAQTFIQNVIFFIDTILDKIKLIGCSGRRDTINGNWQKDLGR